MRISHYVTPPNGWRFNKFSAQTFDELVKIVLEHRKSNNLTIGNPVEEIENQIAEKYPGYVINQLKSKIHNTGRVATVPLGIRWKKLKIRLKKNKIHGS